MRLLKRILGLCICCLLAGCATGPDSLLDPREPPPESYVPQITDESNRLAKERTDLLDAAEKKARPKKIDIEPLAPTYDPLEDHLVSFSMVNEKLEVILYALAQAVGLNLIIDPLANTEDKVLTINFSQVPAASVLKEVLGAFDLYYEIEKNVIRVKPFQEKIFSLNFLDTVLTTDFVVGGDVLSAGESSSLTGLTGSFQLTGKGSAKGVSNTYDAIEEMISRVLSDNGRYSLNRLSGSLYVKDSPERIRSIARLIHHTQKMMSRQIFIDARIIEVALEDEYKYGINWEVLKQEMGDDSVEFNRLAYSIAEGLSLEGLSGDFDYLATMDALNTFGDVQVVSNPIIRTKHGKPALISVGTSISYTKSTETTTIGAGDTATTTTAVEVSKVFDGLILGVMPFIQENEQVSILINPIQSEVDQASLQLVNIGNVSITLPEVGIMEMSSTMTLNDGDTIILGGLIDNRYVTDNKGVPLLSAIPLLGYFFKSEFKSKINKELVIILNIRIV